MPRVIITVPETNPQPYRFPTDREIVTFGRGSNNDIVMDSSSVSVTHAEMRRVQGGYELRDLDSTNGIKLDDERTQVIMLRNGLNVKMGDVTFEFQLTDEESELLAREDIPQLPPIKSDALLPREIPLKARSEPEPEPELSQPEPEPEAEATTHRKPGKAMLWFVIFAVIAFSVGMAVRFQNDTGGSWIKSVMSRLMGSPAKIEK